MGEMPVPVPGGQELLIFDFEPGGKVAFEGAEKLEMVAEHASQGKHAGKIALAKGASFHMFWMFNRGQNGGGHWGEYDRFVMDVFVDGGPVKASGLIRDDQGTDWANRYNFDFELQPGKRQIEIPIGAIIRQKNQKPMNIDKLTSMTVGFSPADADKPATIYLDNARLVKGTGSFESKTLFSFEGTDAGTYVLEDWPEEFKGKSKATVSDEHATGGKKSLCLESHAPAGNVQFAPTFQEWGAYDTLAIDLFNPSDKPIEVGGWIKAKAADTYVDRYNWNRVVRPGQSTLKLAVGGLVTGSRKPFSPDRIERFNLSVGHATLFIDNVRLVKGTEEVPVEGIRKFDFGPAASAVMPGFTAVSRETRYDKAKGFGWLPGGDFQRDYDIREILDRHRPPDSLCRDACSPNKATFAVDLASGDYRAWIMLEPPGGMGWHRTFRHRTVAVQGKTVDDTQYDAESFKKWEFLWEDVEDLPGDDLWERYIDPSYKALLVDAAVADGQLKIDFDGHGEAFAAMICGLVVWPKAQESQAQRWLAGLENLRREQFASAHVEKGPPAPAPMKDAGDADKARGFVRFLHSPDRDVTYNSVPTPEEVARPAIEISAAPGEYEDACIGLVPLKDGAALSVSTGDLAGPGGAKIPASAIAVQAPRYKALNHGPTYTVEPRYLDAIPKEGLPLKVGVTRSVWVIVHVPADAAAGQYRGKVTLAVGDKTDAIDLAVTVWPIKLSEPKLPMGMFMVHPPYSYLALAETKDALWKEWKNVLEDSRAHGMTSVDPIIGMPLKAVKDGKAVIDFTDMDKWMELAKAAGFTNALFGYSLGTGFTLRPQGFEDEKGQGGAPAFGLKTFAEMVKLYFEAYKEHAKEKGYLPLNFCIDDEYLVHSGTPEGLARFGQVFKENAPGLSFVPVDSIYPDEKPAMIPAWEKMLRSLDTWGAGLHSPKVAEIVKAAGCRLWLYNTGMNRFTFGTYMFYAHQKWNVQGFTQWVYGGEGTLGHFDMASHNESWYGIVVPSSRGLRSTVTWERIRAGCDDHRYLRTAWDLIAAAKVSGKGRDEAKALEAAIEKTLARLTFGKTEGVDAASGEGKADNPMDPAQMEALRKTLADGILKLQAAR